MPTIVERDVKIETGTSLRIREAAGAPGPDGRLTPLVCIHGFSLSGLIYERLLAGLPAGYRAIAVDQRGFGDSARPPAGYTIPEFAADNAALLDALGIDRAVVMGHSYGGMVAQQFAVAYPERLLALVPVGTWAHVPPAFGLGEDVGSRLELWRTRGNVPEAFTGRIERYVLARNVTAEEKARFLAIAMGAGTTALIETLTDIYTRPCLTLDQLAAIRAPTLVMAGAEDTIITVPAARRLADAIPGSELVVISDSGHTPMWEQPRAFAGALFGFLARHGL
ncbi:MAG TPA: alpha/beta hydrolase [Methylomirabilota bacterium]|jgi:pimeloyl-ACP methyl ester carboxylesterase|nr:alpha/beta hydrolase [Methylomirabilota bacterium]